MKIFCVIARCTTWLACLFITRYFYLRAHSSGHRRRSSSNNNIALSCNYLYLAFRFVFTQRIILFQNHSASHIQPSIIPRFSSRGGRSIARFRVIVFRDLGKRALSHRGAQWRADVCAAPWTLITEPLTKYHRAFSIDNKGGAQNSGTTSINYLRPTSGARRANYAGRADKRPRPREFLSRQ